MQVLLKHNLPYLGQKEDIPVLLLSNTNGRCMFWKFMRLDHIHQPHIQ